MIINFLCVFQIFTLKSLLSLNYLIKFKKGNVFLDIFSQEIPLLMLSYFRVAADFVKKVLGFVYKGSEAQLCITTFVICFEGLWVTTWYYFFNLCELILNLTKNLEEIHLRIMTVTSKKLMQSARLDPLNSGVRRGA